MKETKLFNYWCPNRIKCDSCDFCDKKGDLQINVEVEVDGQKVSSPDETFSCMSSEVPLKLMGRALPKTNFVPLTQSQIKAERLARSREHFRKEIFHTLDSDAQRHHVRKDPTLKPSVDISLPNVSEGARKEISKKLKK